MDVKVKIILVGGYQYTLELSSDAPLLKSLFEAVAARSHPGKNGCQKMFQIPIDEGKSALCFLSEHITSVLTDPPLAVQRIDDFTLSNTCFFSVACDRVVAAKYLQINNFFTPEENRHLLELVSKKESRFVPSGHGGAYNLERRRSRVSRLSTGDEKAIANRILAKLPEVFRQLEITPFPICEIETQVTASNDGDYYTTHQDRGKNKNAVRELTYVYYFHREPKPFSGGELIIYDDRIENNGSGKAESFQIIEPQNNSIVFFLSRYWHEVRAIACPSQAFADSRFTINGWVKRL